MVYNFNMKSFNPILAVRVRQARTRLGLTQFELSQLTGLSQHRISLVESDKGDLSSAVLPKLARSLNVSVGWLLGEEIENEQGLLPEFSMLIDNMYSMQEDEQMTFLKIAELAAIPYSVKK